MHSAPGLLMRICATLLAGASLLTGCATNIAHDTETGSARLAMQNKALEPSNGGAMITGADYCPATSCSRPPTA